MTVLVLGATGTVGSEVVTQLIGAGRSVRALTRDAHRAGRSLGRGAEIVQGDLTDPGDMARVLDGVSGVIATHGGDSNPERVYYGAVKALVTALNELGVSSPRQWR